MARLTDPTRLQAYTNALGNWQFEGYIRFSLSEQAYRWIRRELEDLTLADLKRLTFEFVKSGGEIDEQPETRPEWSEEFRFHYDLRFMIQGQIVYIETRLHLRLPYVADEPWIEVVNVHAP